MSRRGGVVCVAPMSNAGPIPSYRNMRRRARGRGGRGRALEEGGQRAERKGGVRRPVPERGLGQRDRVPQRRLRLLAAARLLLHQ